MKKSKDLNLGNLSRRDLLKLSAQAGGTMALRGLVPGGALLGAEAALGQGQAAAGDSAVLVVMLNGGYNALFGSAGSFTGQFFGVTAANSLPLSNDLVVDSSFNVLNPFARSHIATVGINHGIAVHGPARAAQFTASGGGNSLMTLAAAMGGSGTIKCVQTGAGAAPGPAAAVNGVSMQAVNNMQTFIDAIGGGTPDPNAPDRPTAAKGVTAAEVMSRTDLEGNPISLATLRDSYKVTVDSLNKRITPPDPAGLTAAYASTGAFGTSIALAEMAFEAGTNVVFTSNAGWDTHGDRTGAVVRGKFSRDIMPALKVLTDRKMNGQTPASGKALNLTIVIIGDFARSLPGSDHASCSVVTVIGSNVAQGTTGKVTNTVSPPNNAGGVNEFWSLVAQSVKVPANKAGEIFGPIGSNQLLLPKA